MKGLSAYEEQVKLAIADGTLSQPERETLKILLPTFNMSEDDAREVEARLKFVEEGKAVPAAPPPAPVPVVATPKPTPAPKIAAPVKVPAQTKPAVPMPPKVPAVKK